MNKEENEKRKGRGWMLKVRGRHGMEDYEEEERRNAVKSKGDGML
jgi:hypothetical protein